MSFALFCCDEELPPRNDPQNLLQCTLQIGYDGAPNPRSGYPQRNSMRILITLKSYYYDETIQGHGDFTGKLEIAWADSPQCKKTVQLDKSNLVDPRRYNAEGNIFTLDPGTETSFFYEWNWSLDGGGYMPEHFPMKADENCFRWEYDKKGRPLYYWHPRQVSQQSIIVKGQIKLFKELAIVYAEPTQAWFEYETYPKGMCGVWPDN